VFTGNDAYWVELDHGVERQAAGCTLHRDRGGEPKWYPSRSARLGRAGWTRVWPRLSDAHWRDVGNGWRLRQHLDPRAVAGVSYSLVQPASGREQAHAEWQWADVALGRLVWAAGGCLWTGSVTADGLGPARCLHDFNDLTFEERVAPYEGVRRLGDERWFAD